MGASRTTADQVQTFLAGVEPTCFLRAGAVRVLKLLPADSIDAFVSDPPYGIELSLQWTRTPKAIRGDGRLEARLLWQQFVPEAFRVAKPDSAHVFFGTWKSPWMHDVLASSFHVKGCIAWVKRQWGLGFYLRPRWELAYLCHKGKPPLPTRAEGDVWEHSRDGRLLHPCQKPVELLRRAVRLVMPPGADPRAFIIADPFAGIASTGVAAVAEQCRFVGCEIDPRHWQLGRRRLVDAVKTARDSRAARDSLPGVDGGSKGL